jgi:hypothetical protein
MSVGNFFSGFSQGLGSVLLQNEQEARAKKERERMLTYQGLGDMFKQAQEQGNNEEAANIFQHMGEIIKDKQYHPMIADIIRNTPPKTKSVQSQASVDAQQKIDNTPTTVQSNQAGLVGDPTTGIVKNMLGQPTTEIDNPALTELERPRRAMEQKVIQKGFFPTPEERAAQELEYKKNAAKEMLPIELQKIGAEAEVWKKKQEAVYGYKGDLEDQKSENRKAEALAKEQAKMQGKSYYNKTLYDITGGNPENATPEQIAKAEDLTNTYVNQGLEKVGAKIKLDNARTSEMLTRHGDRQRKMDIDEKKANAYVDATRSLSSYRDFMKTYYGDKLKLSESAINKKYGDAQALTTQVRAYTKARSEVWSQLKQQEAIASSNFSSDEQRQAAQQKAAALEAQYNYHTKLIDELIGKMYNAPTGTTEVTKSTKEVSKPSTPATKTLNKPSNSSDPLGIR